jgi:hypothetical protein
MAKATKRRITAPPQYLTEYSPHGNYGKSILALSDGESKAVHIQSWRRKGCAASTVEVV